MGNAHLAEQLMIIRQDTLDQLQSEGLAKGIQFQEVGRLGVCKEAQILKHRKRILS